MVLNLGSTFKGACDDLAEAGTRLMPILQRCGLETRTVAYDPLDPSKVDTRTGYWIQVDAALAGTTMPFVERAHRAGRMRERGPDFDFRLPFVHSIVTSASGSRRNAIRVSRERIPAVSRLTFSTPPAIHGPPRALRTYVARGTFGARSRSEFGFELEFEFAFETESELGSETDASSVQGATTRPGAPSAPLGPWQVLQLPLPSTGRFISRVRPW